MEFSLVFFLVEMSFSVFGEKWADASSTVLVILPDCLFIAKVQRPCSCTTVPIKELVGVWLLRLCVTEEMLVTCSEVSYHTEFGHHVLLVLNGPHIEPQSLYHWCTF
jgi:hypothetical protein